jgi:hypothetical protein
MRINLQVSAPLIPFIAKSTDEGKVRNSGRIDPYYLFYSGEGENKSFVRRFPGFALSSYGLDGQGVGVRVPVGEDYSPTYVVQIPSGAHPVSYPMDIGRSFPGVKRPGRETDNSPPNYADVKKTWICTSTPPYVSMAQCLIS